MNPEKADTEQASLVPDDKGSEMKVARVFFYRIFFSCRSRLQNGLELAKITNLPVLYIPDEVPPNIVVPVKTATEAPVIALKEAPVMAAKPTGETVAVAEVVVRRPCRGPQACQKTVDLREGDRVGKLEVPRIGISVIVLQGSEPH